MQVRILVRFTTSTPVTPRGINNHNLPVEPSANYTFRSYLFIEFWNKKHIYVFKNIKRIELQFNILIIWVVLKIK